MSSTAFVKFREANTRKHLDFLYNPAFLEYQSSSDDHVKPFTQYLSTLVPIVQIIDGKNCTSERACNLHEVLLDSVLQLAAPG